jgi:hypothetical protein
MLQAAAAVNIQLPVRAEMMTNNRRMAAEMNFSLLRANSGSLYNDDHSSGYLLLLLVNAAKGSRPL